jgi:hypothetical protein
VVRNSGTEREMLISSARFPLVTNSTKLSEEISWGRGWGYPQGFLIKNLLEISI